MSPAGGVGINLAIQDAVAAANILEPFDRASRSFVTSGVCNGAETFQPDSRRHFR
jgi:2-polyprenyl-6-methoxyphenol hydroxylase-like FAD-dependent oxidoreductase